MVRSHRMMDGTNTHHELLHAVAETLNAAQDLITSLGTLRDATEVDKEHEQLVGNNITDDGRMAQSGSEANGQSSESRYNHRVMVLASEESVNHLVNQESMAHPAEPIVAIEFEVGPETPGHVLLVMDAILSEFPHLSRLVVDMHVVGDSLKELLQLMSSKCPRVTSFSFKHLVNQA